MAANDDRRREEEALQAYHDGELGYWARRKVQRRLERSSGLRRELAELEALSGLVLESAPEVVVPDLWTGIARGLSAVDAERAAGEPAAPRAVAFEWLFRRSLRWWRPVQLPQRWPCCSSAARLFRVASFIGWTAAHAMSWCSMEKAM